MSTTKTYADLGPDSGTGVPIGKCSGLLPNHMQCWRAGDVLVSAVTQTTVPAHTVNETEIPEAVDESVTSYQLCRRHATIEQDRDAKLAAAEATLAAAEVEVATDTPVDAPVVVT